jgi:hypothetical protein
MSQPTRCSCGARERCAPRTPTVHQTPPAPDRPDPAEHWQRLGGDQVAAALYGSDTAWRLWGYAKLWLRDGEGSPWHAEYWRTWDRRRPVYLTAVSPPPIDAMEVA